MPTYEYQCNACGHKFEELQSMTSKPIRKCPKCGRLSVKRLLGAGAGVLVKGSGFYQTDYKSKPPKESAKESSKESPKETPKEKPGDKKAKPS